MSNEVRDISNVGGNNNPSSVVPLMHQSSVTHYLHPSSSIATTPAPITTTSTANGSMYLGRGATQTIGSTAQSSLQQYSSYTSSSVPLDANDIFPHITKRKGKWTPEEEKYANFLVREFENGTVPDCENGNTLRAFLSRKLHCAPMRISKKFAGKSIGKHVFIARISTSSTASSSFNYSSNNNDTLFANRIKLRELEQAFLKSISDEMSAPLPLPIVQMMSQSNFSNNHHHHKYNNHNYNASSHHHQGVKHVSSISTHNNKSITEFPASSHNQQETTHISSISTQNNKSMTEFPLSFHDNDNNHCAASNKPLPPSASSTNCSVYHQYHQHMPQVQSSFVSSNPVRPSQSEPIDLTKYEDGNNYNVQSNNSNATNAFDNNTNATHQQISSGGIGESLVPNGIMSMNDFLAGFDNINNNNAFSSSNYNENNALSSNRTSYNDNNHKQQLTDCQTTQSFDDLHQFWGKEMPTTTAADTDTSISESNTNKISDLDCNMSNNNSKGRSAITITTQGTKEGLPSTNAIGPLSQHLFEDKQQQQQQSLGASKLSKSGDNVLISDQGLVQNSYCSIVNANYSCQDNDITAPTLTTTSQSEQPSSSTLSSSSHLNNSTQISKYHLQQFKLDTGKKTLTNTGKKNISYDDYALFAQSACNGIRDYYYHSSSYSKLIRPNQHHHNVITTNNNTNNDSSKIRSSTITARTNSSSSLSCLGKRSANACYED